MDGWMNGRMNGWMDGWMNECMDVSNDGKMYWWVETH